MKIKPLLSIITVTYNAEKTIDSTINSILSQKFSDFELIIVDGLSDDDTLEKLNRYTKKFIQKDIPVKLISEKDDGIYDAMNKGAEIANGKWLFFLNSGDELYNNEVFSRVFQKEKEDKYTIIYGDVQLEYKHYKKVKKQNKVDKNYFILNTINHQSVFIKKESFIKKGKFNTRRSICADKELLLKIVLDPNLKRKYMDLIVSNYKMDGISIRNQKKNGEGKSSHN